jgi:hypothetical protein
MKQTRLAWTVLLAAVSVLTVSLPYTANAATKAAKPRTSAVAVYDCQNKPVVRPRTFALACDGSDDLTKLHWVNWASTFASATATQDVDTCLPNCAQGKWEHLSAIVILWHSVPVSHGRGKRAYSKITVLYPNAQHASQQSWTGVPPGAY